MDGALTGDQLYKRRRTVAPFLRGFCTHFEPIKAIQQDICKLDTRQAFARAFREIRKSRGLTQEDFAVVSSRTYVSTLERGLKSPTLDKMEELSTGLGVHPLTLLTLSFLTSADGKMSVDEMLTLVKQELEEFVPN